MENRSFSLFFSYLFFFFPLAFIRSFSFLFLSCVFTLFSILSFSCIFDLLHLFLCRYSLTRVFLDIHSLLPLSLSPRTKYDINFYFPLQLFLSPSLSRVICQERPPSASPNLSQESLYSNHFFVLRHAFPPFLFDADLSLFSP